MATSLRDDIRGGFMRSDILTQLILVNVAVFVVMFVSTAIFGLFQTSMSDTSFFVQWFAVPSSVAKLLSRPWSIITYMFMHGSIMHILFNMLWLFWMGKIFLEYLGAKKLFSTYILGGISGAVLYILSYNIFPRFDTIVHSAYALGASASVMAIVIATATLLPDYTVMIILIGAVRLKYIAAFTVVLDLMSVSGDNAGGHIAHLGGALFGFLYIRNLQQGRDFASGFNKLMDKIVSLFKPRTRMKVEYKRSKSDEDFIKKKKSQQDQIDEILDKISKSGYGSLTKEEREILFKSSKEN